MHLFFFCLSQIFCHGSVKLTHRKLGPQISVGCMIVAADVVQKPSEIFVVEFGKFGEVSRESLVEKATKHSLIIRYLL